VELMTGDVDVGWLSAAVDDAQLTVHECRNDDVPIDDIVALRPDWVVVDSYLFDPKSVSVLNDSVPVLAIIDGDDRGIDAELYLDQNLGAEDLPRRPGVAERILSGARFALVRDAILSERRVDPWLARSDRLAVLSFMGGSDPTRTSTIAAAALDRLTSSIDLTIVAPEWQHPALIAMFGETSRPRILPPTSQLPVLLGKADIVLSAAGTSAWDICALGIPSILVAVVNNQRASLAQAIARGLTLGIDAAVDEGVLARDLGPLLTTLVEDTGARRALSDACLRTFDGQGKERVAAQMESHARG
jgi:spore coat polysaccharide biosynthesis predicted glycosyltransferase SpsG